MATFNLSWTVAAGTTEQKLYLQPAGGSFQQIATLGPGVNTYTVIGAQDNLIYAWYVKTYCVNGSPADSPVQYFINITCPELTLTPDCGAVDYSFSDLGNSITEYDVVLYNSSEVEVQRQTKSPAATITGSFSSLAGEALYYVSVVPKAGEDFIKEDCELQDVTTLQAPPVVVTSPSSQALCDDGPASIVTLTASFTGTGLVYSWYRNSVLITDGGNYSGATTDSLTIQNAGSILGSFTCRADGDCGYAVTQAAVISLLQDTQITVNPGIIPSCITSSIPLSVTAGGGNLTYQWQKSTDGGSNYNDILGATSATYNIPAGTAAEGDKFRVKVNSTCGPEVTSTAATVDIVPAPTITADPTNQQACAGNSATFTASYTSEVSATVNWQLLSDGQWYDISGATSTSYNTSTVGQYRLKVVNACGTSYSNSATLTNYTNVAFSATAGNSDVCTGTSVTFTNTVTGSVVSMQWSVSTDGGTNYSALPGETSASLNLGAVTYAQTGYKYKLTVTGQCNTVNNVSTLTVRQGITASTGPSDETICDGSQFTFSISVTSDAAVTYLWERSPDNSTWTTVGSSSSYSATGTLALNGYYYRVTATSCSSSVNYTARLYVNPGTASITSQPSSQSVCAGTNVNFSVTATGATGYQWQIFTAGTWNNIIGATSSTLTLTSVTTGMSGNIYRVLVGSACGNLVSTSVTLTVTTTAANWVNRDINTYYVCVGADKYYEQIDTNPCSATYNTTQTGSLYQANSASCGYTPVCNPPAILSVTLNEQTTSPSQQCLNGLVIETIYIFNSADLALLPSGYTHPCPSQVGAHGCNRAFFEVYANGVYIGDSRMNNGGGTGGATTQSGGFTCQDYLNTPAPITGGTWTGTINSRYSVMTITPSKALDIAVAAGGSSITFSLVSAMLTYGATCDGTIAPHENVTWTRISRSNGELIYNGCPVGNVTTVNVCSNS